MLQNPFLGRGEPVVGERIVGREEILEKLYIRLFTCKAHCSIVGLPRMGKTSIVKELISRFKKNKINISFNYVTLDAFSSSQHCFRRILEEVFDDSIDNDLSINNSEDECYNLFIRVLRKKTKEGFSGILAIDEFDAVTRDKFANAQLFISRLREIANEREKYGLTFIFISRRPLDLIQGLVDCSTLAGICEVIYIKPLDFESLKLLAMRSQRTLDSSGFFALNQITGGHPYLAEVIMCEAFDLNFNNISKNEIEKSLERQVHEFTNYYRQLKALLSYENHFDVFCEIIVGPQHSDFAFGVKSALKQYGLVKVADDKSFPDCMSEHLKQYLELVVREKPTWSLLGEVEKHLRVLVNDRYIDKFGFEWLKSMSEKNENLKVAINKMNEIKNKEKKYFGNDASENPLSYSYIDDLKVFIFQEWSLFQKNFGDSKKELESYFQVLIKARNPLAHNRKLPLETVRDVERVCNIILKKIMGEN